MGVVDAIEWAWVLACGHCIKMTEQVEQWICIKFCIKLEQYYMESIQMTQKVTAMGNWWLAASSQQCGHSCITSRAEIFGKTSSNSGDSALLHPRFATLHLLAFPKTKITFKREEISGHWWDSGIYDIGADGDWEICAKSQGAYFKGDWGAMVLCTTFHASCIVFNKCLCFFVLHVWIPSG